MITVIIPVLNESKTIGNVVRAMRHSPNVTEVIVVDDGSIDGTPDFASQAGATVLRSTLLGKGASMYDGARAAKNKCILFVDGDLSSFSSDLVERIARPIIEDRADLVKARFTRTGGRVTELSAKPLLKMFFPELLHIDQPLGGIVATKKCLITSLALEDDYGVDVGLLIDTFFQDARIQQVDIGYLEHDSQPLENLRRMALQVIRTILDRARRFGRLTGSQIQTFHEQERVATAEIDSVLELIGKSKRLALIDMDGTLIQCRFIEELAKAIGKEEKLVGLLDNSTLNPMDRSDRIAALLTGTPQEVFRNVALNCPLTNGAAELVIGLRKRGYKVGIVSDSYYIASDVIRRRVFADFSIAHVLNFRDGLASGEVTISPAMRHVRGCRLHQVCKTNVLRHISDGIGRPQRVIAIGDNDGDSCLLKTADVGIAFESKTRNVADSADYEFHGNLASILNCIDHEFNCSNTQWVSPYLAAKMTGDGLIS